jgi:hypothetical protein
MIHFLHILVLFLSKKRQYFRQIFRRKYLKNHNIGPRKSRSHVLPLTYLNFGAKFMAYIFQFRKCGKQLNLFAYSNFLQLFLPSC